MSKLLNCFRCKKRRQHDPPPSETAFSNAVSRPIHTSVLDPTSRTDDSVHELPGPSYESPALRRRRDSHASYSRMSVLSVFEMDPVVNHPLPKRRSVPQSPAYAAAYRDPTGRDTALPNADSMGGSVLEITSSTDDSVDELPGPSHEGYAAARPRRASYRPQRRMSALNHPLPKRRSVPQSPAYAAAYRESVEGRSPVQPTINVVKATATVIEPQFFAADILINDRYGLSAPIRRTAPGPQYDHQNYTEGAPRARQEAMYRDLAFDRIPQNYFEAKPPAQNERKKILNYEEKLKQVQNVEVQLLHTEEKKTSLDKLGYKFDPVLVPTIETIAGEKKDKWICGLTILDKELFFVSRSSSEVEVYDSIKLSFIRRWNLNELIDPLDIAACKRNKCLYIFDYKRFGKSKEILRVDPMGRLIKKWSTGKDYGFSLSVTDESSVILAALKKNKLKIYSPCGQLIREINLSDASIVHPWHAIKLTNGHFVVSHGGSSGQLRRVCVVDADGKLQKSFGGKRGSTNGQMNRPVHLSVDGNGFVMVSDRRNRRVLLLDSDLELKREILSESKNGLRDPTRILLDESVARLFVADNSWNSYRGLLIFDFK